MNPKRPILRYFGGKWLLAPWIINQFPPHRVYVEPFGGAASVLLRKQRSYAEIWNDIEDGVVTLFRVLRDEDAAKELLRRLELTPFAREEFVLAGSVTGEPIEDSRRLIVRSYFGFGADSVTAPADGRAVTGFRNDSNRSGGTPARDWKRYPDALRLAVDRLRGVVIENKPALYLVEKFDRKDALFYVDPPYVHSTRSAGKHGYKFEMSDEDHRELAAALQRVAGSVVISGYSSELYDELYGDWHKVERTAYADGANERTEVLWLNSACVAMHKSGSLI